MFIFCICCFLVFTVESELPWLTWQFLRSPHFSTQMTVKEQQEWKIPPCISNWKNAKVHCIHKSLVFCLRVFLYEFSPQILWIDALVHIFLLILIILSQGYTIPLDKRLAADGRGLQTVHINENFAKLAEALYIADRKVRSGSSLARPLSCARVLSPLSLVWVFTRIVFVRHRPGRPWRWELRWRRRWPRRRRRRRRRSWGSWPRWLETAGRGLKVTATKVSVPLLAFSKNFLHHYFCTISFPCLTPTACTRTHPRLISRVPQLVLASLSPPSSRPSASISGGRWRRRRRRQRARRDPPRQTERATARQEHFQGCPW